MCRSNTPVGTCLGRGDSPAAVACRDWDTRPKELKDLSAEAKHKQCQDGCSHNESRVHGTHCNLWVEHSCTSVAGEYEDSFEGQVASDDSSIHPQQTYRAKTEIIRHSRQEKFGQCCCSDL